MEAYREHLRAALIDPATGPAVWNWDQWAQHIVDAAAHAVGRDKPLRELQLLPGHRRALMDDQTTHLRVWTGLASGFFNAVARARWSKGIAPAAVRAIAADLSGRRAPWRWYVGSAGGSEELGRLLKSAGLMPVPAQTPMLLRNRKTRANTQLHCSYNFSNAGSSRGRRLHLRCWRLEGLPCKFGLA